MKMVKSLLLVSAAGLVAVSGAQAADLPVKAKPVEYVKVCSLYGAGFYYIPGTDICMKIGGYVRFQESFGHVDNTRASRKRHHPDFIVLVFHLPRFFNQKPGVVERFSGDRFTGVDNEHRRHFLGCGGACNPREGGEVQSQMSATA